jgi:transposase
MAPSRHIKPQRAPRYTKRSADGALVDEGVAFQAGHALKAIVALLQAGNRDAVAGVKILFDLKRKFRSMWHLLDERTRRITAASEAVSLGRGGVSLVSRACGLSRQTITRGIREIKDGTATLPGRVRRSGAGRKSITAHDPKLVDVLDGMIDGDTRGDPESPLRWICKSTRAIAAALTRKGHPVSYRKVGQLLHEQNYSLQSNRKTKEGEEDHPDRDAQFRHISAEIKRFMSLDLPVISCDTKKKELLGNYKNNGQQWLPKETPFDVNAYDFPHPKIPRAYPYGIYDVGRNTGFVNIGTDHDTGEFAVASIRGWWRAEGRRIYPKTRKLLITVDGGGSNGYRLRLWKLELQKLSDETGLDISVCHFPPGTSKWNKIEHKLFSFISSNWRGEPLRDYETIVNLIAKTTTAQGLKVTCRLDRSKYPTGRKITAKEMKGLNLTRDKFHGEWNYTIAPKAA